MVNRTLLLFVLLGGLFIVLCTVLLNAQLPENTPLFALFHHTDNLDLLLLQSYTLPRICIANNWLSRQLSCTKDPAPHCTKPRDSSG